MTIQKEKETMKEQAYTSANTSINHDKLPAVFGKLKDLHNVSILDYGCGKYPEIARDWCKARNCQYFPYDKFNQSEETNSESMENAKHAENLIVVCSNVLNVIDSDDVVSDILATIQSFGTTAYITVYDGDGKGTGRKTGNDQWQRNQKLRSYAAYVPTDAHVSFKHGMMIME